MTDKALKKIFQMLTPENPEELRYFLQHLPRYEQTLRAVKNHISGKVVADLGTVPGHLVRACKSLGAARAIGLDYDPERFGFGERLRTEGVEILKCDLENGSLPLADESADLILFTEVIEHLPTNAQKVLAECRRVLNAGGQLVLTTPNANNLANRVRRLLGRQTDITADDWGARPQQKHQREYTQKEMMAMLKKAGFKIVRIEKIEYAWNTEFDTPPDWMKGPFPWDWMVIAKKT